MNNVLYYTNKLEYPGGCPLIPTRPTNFLDKNNYLSEFITSSDKEIARANLGIPDIINALNLKIDAKVIERGNVAWDLQPTEGNTDKVLSSNAIYNVLLRYALVTELDNNILQIWANTINKINETYNTIETEINQHDSDLRNEIELILTNITTLNNHVDETLLLFNELKQFVLNEYTNLYNSLYENLTNNKIVQLESKMKSMQLLMETFLRTASGGTALTDLFGSDEYIGVNQKTLTSAINKLWDKIEEITGETTQGINMVVSPTYFIGEDGCTVNISASSLEANGIFEHIAFYSDGNLIAEADNKNLFNTQTHINETTEIKCVAKIMGVEYTKTKTITHYNSFFLLSGSFESEESAVEYAMNHPEYSRPVTSGLRGAYNITCNLNDNIIVIFGSSFASAFLRVDLNSIEIPLEHKTVTVDDKEYVVFISTNRYNAGTYNIDING